MKIFRFLVGILALILVFLSCKFMLSRNEKFTLEELKALTEIDRVEVFHEDSSTGENHLINIITDTQKIDSVVDISRAYAENWQYEYPYAKPGPLRVRFFDAEEQKLEVMIGYHYRESANKTRFYLSVPFGPGKTLQQQEFDEIINVLDVDASLAKIE